MLPPTLYEECGRFDQILELCERWHERCLANPDASHPFEHGVHPHHSIRLAAYLSEAFGGPALYSAGYGDESSVQQMHACNGEHLALDEACLKEFELALQEAHFPPAAAARALAYFRSAVEGQRVWSQPSSQVPAELPFNYADRA
jgi:hemoglobin